MKSAAWYFSSLSILWLTNCGGDSKVNVDADGGTADQANSSADGAVAVGTGQAQLSPDGAVSVGTGQPAGAGLPSAPTSNGSSGTTSSGATGGSQPSGTIVGTWLKVINNNAFWEIAYNADGTYQSDFYGVLGASSLLQRDVGTYTISGNTITATPTSTSCPADKSGSFTFSLADQQMTLTFAGSATSFIFQPVEISNLSTTNQTGCWTNSMFTASPFQAVGVGGTGLTTWSGQRADIPGPSMMDQAPIPLTATHLLSGAATTLSALAVDSSGNVAIDDGALKTFKEDGALNWTYAPTQPALSAVNAMRYAADGSVLYGLSTATGIQVADVANGQPRWSDMFACSGGGLVERIIVGDAHFAVWGRCSGQLEGNPAASTGGLFLATYDATGKRGLLKQFAPPTSSNDAPLSGGFMGKDGKIYVSYLDQSTTAGGYHIASYSPSGDLIKDTRFTSFGADFVERSDDGLSAYVLARTALGKGALMKLSLDGAILWYRLLGASTGVINTAENVIWTGLVQGVIELAVTSDSVYILGGYTNTYTNGSMPKPMTSTLFVLRTDLEGNQVWFQELSSTSINNVTAGFSITSSGNPSIIVSDRIMQKVYRVGFDRMTGSVQ